LQEEERGYQTNHKPKKSSLDEFFHQTMSEGAINKTVLLSSGSVAQLKHPKKSSRNLQVQSTQNLQKSAL
jgi:hypothetical protein